ncbi:MAG: hypothetical protein AAFQ43_01780 [Bacteroidota bacterium]
MRVGRSLLQDTGVARQGPLAPGLGTRQRPRLGSARSRESDRGRTREPESTCKEGEAAVALATAMEHDAAGRLWGRVQADPEPRDRA